MPELLRKSPVCARGGPCVLGFAKYRYDALAAEAV
jgi:hypothetical protein